MSKRIYQIIALAILIGAPILINAISSALPGAGRAAHAAAQKAPGPGNPAVVAATPAAAAAITPPPQIAPSTNAVADVTPTLDATGIAPASSDDAMAAPAPPPPVVIVPPVQAAPVASDYVPPRKTTGPRSLSVQE